MKMIKNSMRTALGGVGKRHPYTRICLSLNPIVRIYQIIKFYKFAKSNRHNIRRNPRHKNVYILKPKEK